MPGPAPGAIAALALDPPLGTPSDADRDRLFELITFPQAADELPRRRGGKKTHLVTFYRWSNHGCRGVTLRYTMVGATRCTTRQWLADFFTALTERGKGEPAPRRTQAETHRAADQAMRERDVTGI